MDALRQGDPTRLGPFVLVGRLGSGGMGVVYLGRLPDGRSAAVKVVHPHLTTESDFPRRFAREIETARRVDAPWTARVIEADPLGDQPWLATEYIDGPSLDDHVAHAGPLAAQPAVILAIGLAEALAGLHAVGVVHRDVKPSNVLLALDGPRLIDFGIARALDATKITYTGHVIGSPAYMSPEQAAGEDSGPPSDVFSLASVLVFAATGTGPYGTSSTPLAMLLRVTQHEPDTTEVPADLRPHLEACLARDPTTRPTARQLLQRLRDAADTVDVSDAPAAPPAATMAYTAASWPAPGHDSDGRGGADDPPPSPTRRRLLIAAGAATLVAATVAASVIVTDNLTRRPPEPATPLIGAEDLIPLPGRVKRLAFAPDSSRMYVCLDIAGGGSLAVLDIPSGNIIKIIQPQSPPMGVGLSPDGSRLYVGLLVHGIGEFDAETLAAGRVIDLPGDYPEPAGTIEDMVIASGGRRAYVAHALSNHVSSYDLAAGKLLRVAEFDADFPNIEKTIAMSGDGAHVLACIGKDIVMLDPDSLSATRWISQRGDSGVTAIPHSTRVIVRGSRSVKDADILDTAIAGQMPVVSLNLEGIFSDVTPTVSGSQSYFISLDESRRAADEVFERLYIQSSGGDNILRPIATIESKLSLGSQIRITPNGRQLVVFSTHSTQLAIIDIPGD